MANTPTNDQDILDSRDIIERIDELESLRDSLSEALESGDAELIERCELSFGEEEREELRVLSELAEEASSSPDWQYGESLIRESHFVEYARQFAEDVGLVSRRRSWPSNHIDWEAAARSLRMDYFSVDFGGVEYLIRS